ncbi:hypothetical protein F441_00338 [Phytophthora nicotianae CJ01A1]|uniref:Uncharacterized protein n=3 Tax=Phytophthora nicotianae TaxID=4792 RepID=W2GBF8_PHYNI|nr:hypothetical protein L915_13955 [Phytophthora nicotianae]ETL33773.1 hypothetical protein L916_13852 [Phytophthora nicotianae]ETO86077.1 hypothetical protein F444_00346 [Phytophthora nicotianae P1976]ETP27119.1 hypothetical protein F441_00338 [Phytophthora nicotianae CJ01A1]
MTTEERTLSDWLEKLKAKQLANKIMNGHTTANYAYSEWAQKR